MSTTHESLDDMKPDEKNAFLKGYDDCKRGQTARGAMSLASAPFTPPAAFEAAYKLGWTKASQEVIVAAEKAGRRGEGWGEIRIGGALFLAGVAVTVGTLVTGGDGYLWI